MKRKTEKKIKKILQNFRKNLTRWKSNDIL